MPASTTAAAFLVAFKAALTSRFAAHPTLSGIVNAILILVIPNTVAKNVLRLDEWFFANCTIAVQGNFRLRRLAIKNYQMPRGSLSDEILVDERRKRKPGLRTRLRRKMRNRYQHRRNIE